MYTTLGLEWSCFASICCSVCKLQFAKRYLPGLKSPDVARLSSPPLSVVQHLCQKSCRIFVCHWSMNILLILLLLIVISNKSLLLMARCTAVKLIDIDRNNIEKGGCLSMHLLRYLTSHPS